ncbi:hypothetical protein HRI_001180700 [Hibiscus trionum]|uniref:Endonuclease/exonuclease/phosphatase domain-containing protein n=1 Tax=Hibiscus trionum TaxID=183268 RepID=A0A9W7HCS9_HIBTR|nr:hypothetical protein HRI_001180700 [Hibiscus trionum]
MDFFVLSWNIRGVRRREKKKAIRDSCRRCKANFLFLQETKVESIQLADVRKIWPRNNSDFAVSPACGSAGGLLSIWDKEFFTASEIIIKRRFIILLGSVNETNFRCGLINTYGPSVDAEKEGFLSELLHHLSQWQIPWCLGGDFNLFLDEEEKIGFTINKTMISMFRSFVFEAGLIDLPLSGGKFTWSNSREIPTFVRLDRFLISTSFNLEFPQIVQNLLDKSLSDHNAIHLSVEKVDWGPKPFRVFNSWFLEKDFEKTVVNALSNQKRRNKATKIGGLIKGTKEAIKGWSKKRGRDFQKLIPVLERQISELEIRIQEGEGSEAVFIKLCELKGKLWAQYRIEESQWLQKSRLNWNLQGDRNTHFFI